MAKLKLHPHNAIIARGNTLSRWDATVQFADRFANYILSLNRRQKFAWDRKFLACIANWPRTVANGLREFKHVILFCVTQIIAKQSPSHRMCRETVANPSQPFADTSQFSFRDLHNATNLICDKNANRLRYK